MAVNLLKALENEFSEDAIAKIASFAGETPANTQTALGHAIPAIVGALAQKLPDSTRGHGPVRDAAAWRLRRSDIQGSGQPAQVWIRRLGRAQGRRAPDLVALWRSSDRSDGLDCVRRRNSFAVVCIVARHRHAVRPRSGEPRGHRGWRLQRVLHCQTPRPTGGISSKRRSARTGHVAGVERLGRTGTGLRAAGEPARAYSPPVRPPAAVYDRPGSFGWLKWALPLLLLPLLLWGLTGLRTREPRRRGRRHGWDVAAMVKQRLSCGQELDVAPNGVETRLVRFIDDRALTVDKEAWVSFDRLEFESGSATLRPSSQAQLQNIAEILRCYPNVNLKIGGYTDNVGDPASNLTLSQARAENTRQTDHQPRNRRVAPRGRRLWRAVSGGDQRHRRGPPAQPADRCPRNQEVGGSWVGHQHAGARLSRRSSAPVTPNSVSPPGRHSSASGTSSQRSLLSGSSSHCSPR